MKAPARAWSVALMGIDGQLVEVEAAIGGGLPRTVLVGLPDASLSEARDRCRAAALCSGLGWPDQLVTINLTPASLPKSGTHFDLSIVAAVWAAAGTVPRESTEAWILLGEVGLDARVRPVRGMLPALVAAVAAGRRRAMVPASQAHEARLISGLEVYPVGSLADVAAGLRGQESTADVGAAEETVEPEAMPDLADVVGQAEARWALEVAAAGGHHAFLHGPPGVGKTMLAQRLPGLLPELTDAEALEVAAVHSLCDVVARRIDDRRPPIAAPHHGASAASIIGGGQRWARPGAMSLAHRGVLFLDEAPEFSPRILEGLRTPLESGVVTIGRAHGHARFPAAFQLVLAANPCPCGLAASKGGHCRCTPMAVRRYASRLSGPILDRVDIRAHLREVQASYVAAAGVPEASAVVAARVAQARMRQSHRLVDTPWRVNAQVPGAHMRRHWPAPAGTTVIERAIDRGRLTARGVDKIIRLAWTMADLDGVDAPTADHVHASLVMRVSQA